jgi:hypothetical protein
VTSQLPVEHWHEMLGDPTIADAILDRLVHNAYRLTLKGESLRKAAAKRHKLDDEPAADLMTRRRESPPREGGRDHRNLWPASLGTGGRLRSESPADFVGMRIIASGPTGREPLVGLKLGLENIAVAEQPKPPPSLASLPGVFASFAVGRNLRSRQPPEFGQAPKVDSHSAAFR